VRIEGVLNPRCPVLNKRPVTRQSRIPTGCSCFASAGPGIRSLLEFGEQRPQSCTQRLCADDRIPCRRRRRSATGRRRTCYGPWRTRRSNRRENRHNQRRSRNDQTQRCSPRKPTSRILENRLLWRRGPSRGKPCSASQTFCHKTSLMPLYDRSERKFSPSGYPQLRSKCGFAGCISCGRSVIWPAQRG